MIDHDQYLDTFGAVVRARRKDLGMTQEELASKVNCSLYTIGLVERGRANPTMRLVLRICGALEVFPQPVISEPPKE
jgi:transcriptional regulator with XRE-family HTH domain